jgi:hypothetical protein
MDLAPAPEGAGASSAPEGAEDLRLGSVFDFWRLSCVCLTFGVFDSDVAPAPEGAGAPSAPEGAEGFDVACVIGGIPAPEGAGIPSAPEGAEGWLLSDFV